MQRTHLFPKLLLLIVITSLATAAVAQKYGGTLKRSVRENPYSASLWEESAQSATVANTHLLNSQPRNPV